MSRIEYLAQKMSKPDMSGKCRDFISAYIKNNNVENVLEFGSGGSTKMFADLGCSVITIEHEPEFYWAGRTLWKDIHSIKPFLAMDRRSYIHFAFLKIDNDLVFVDGVYREIIMTALRDYGKWETIMVHDSERQEYQPHFNYLREVSKDISPEGINLFVCQKK
jgi:hypothetical protein